MNKNLGLSDEQYAYLSQMRSGRADPLLRELQTEAAQLGDASVMIAAPEQGDLFTLLAAALRVQSALEIGTFVGFSSLCLARGLAPGGRLLCLDVSREWTDIARRYWARAGVADRIDLILGPAAESLARLDPERTFDFVFIDADKTGYDAYYELVLPRVRPNGLILFDNMLSHGALVRPTSDRGIALDLLNRKLADDSRVDCVLLPVADGVMFCRKK